MESLSFFEFYKSFLNMLEQDMLFFDIYPNGQILSFYVVNSFLSNFSANPRLVQITF